MADYEGDSRKRRIQACEPIRLEEYIEVNVLIHATAPSDADDPTGWKAAKAPIEFIGDAPADRPDITTNTYVQGAALQQTPIPRSAAAQFTFDSRRTNETLPR